MEFLRTLTTLSLRDYVVVRVWKTHDVNKIYATKTKIIDYIFGMYKYALFTNTAPAAKINS